MHSHQCRFCGTVWEHDDPACYFDDEAECPNCVDQMTFLSGAVRVYPDGREVCQDSKAGWLEYNRRVKVMVQRQNRRCCLCGRPVSLGNATFEHQRRRGMGAAWRDDRITKDGADWNGAAHWNCNSEKG